MDLRQHVETIRVLNIDNDASSISPQQLVHKETFNDKSYLVSDADEELIILVEFKQIIHLQSVTLHSLNHSKLDDDGIDTSQPKQIHIYKIDGINKSFDDIQSMKSDKSLTCSIKKLSKGQKINLKKTSKNAIKFQKIRFLAIYVESNQNDTENTHLNGIKFYGKGNGEKIIDASKMSIKHRKKMVKHNKNQEDLAQHNLLKEVDYMDKQ
eukprot:93803_1